MEKETTPVLLLTGYLGSGKTTLLNRILSNRRGIKFAVIVNDIGEVNIDADLIEKGGIVGSQDDSLVALQNGCICCTLKMDLVEQLRDIIKMRKFDYIVIEASGICEPAPIAQTICSIPQLGEEYVENGYPVLDSIVTVVDALRMKDEFGSGNDLLRANIDDEDIENLVIQQIEFCNIVLLNKAAEVEPQELQRIKEIVRALQPKADIIECNYGDVDLDKILNTGKFDFMSVATSATWIEKVEGAVEEDDDDDDEHEEHEHHHHHDEHGHHHHHHHHHHHDGEHDADEIFDDIGLETAAKLDVEVLKNAFSALEDEEKYGAVLRMKGIMPTPDGRWIHFDYTPGESEIREGGADYTGRLCVIGVGLKRENILELLKI
jgi:G3E family GTPase